MINSMTGYGKADVVKEKGRIVVEIRSVNHRYGEVSVKLPRVFIQFENMVRKAVAERLKRGKIEVYIQWEEPTGVAGRTAINIPLAMSYYDAFTAIKESLGLNDEVSLSLISAQKGVLVSADNSSEEADTLQAELFAVVRSAVDNLEKMRSLEGEALVADLLARRKTLALLLDKVSVRAPEAVLASAGRLQERLAQLLGETPLDQARLAQEIAVLADRSDISEELVRFGSHLQQFDNALQLAEPVGRKLDFLLQEMNREVNTIGAKANDAEIASYVVGLKAELEKIREQVQNVE